MGTRKKEKGPLHVRLQGLLVAAWKSGDITQESLGQAIGQSQENAGQYLRGNKAGALDLDEAVSALHHIGLSLKEFLDDAPPPTPTRAARLSRKLEARPELLTAVEALLGVPRTRLRVVLEQIETGVFSATGRRLRLSDEWGDETK